MCGIYGFTKKDKVNILPTLIKGLETMSYRGYDSSGMCVIKDGSFVDFKAIGSVEKLKESLPQSLEAQTTIGHIRWATHGTIAIKNTHPFLTKHFALVHNGIIENIDAIKQLIPHALTPQGNTDSEVVCAFLEHLFATHQSSFFALEHALDHIQGRWAFAILCTNNPNSILFARKGSPVILGVSPDGHYIASDSSSFPRDVTHTITLENDDYGFLREDQVVIYNNKREVSRPQNIYVFDEEAYSKGSFPSFMLKEIYQQPSVVDHILRNSIVSAHPFIPSETFRNITRIRPSQLHIIACGSSYYASLMGVNWLSSLANLDAYAYIASEYAWQCSTPYCVFVSQSGETADLLRLFAHPFKPSSKHILGMINQTQSSLAHLASILMPLYAGKEISVASTKAFLAQSVSFLLLALAWGRETTEHLWPIVHNLPKELAHVISSGYAFFEGSLPPLTHINHYLFSANETLYPIMVEGSLKMKELSYITSSAFSFINIPFLHINNTTSLILVLDKNELSSAHHIIAHAIRSTNTPTIVITNGPASLPPQCLHFEVPSCNSLIFPILVAPLLQILSHLIASQHKRDIDQPRNLAKSVTVE